MNLRIARFSLRLGQSVFVALFGVFALAAPSFAQSADPHPVIEVYPGPAGLPASPRYTVQILQGTKAYGSFVYQIQNPAFLPDGRPAVPPAGVGFTCSRELTTAWTDFGTNVPVTVQVTNAHPFLSVRILPTSAHIVPIVHGNVVSFPMSSTAGPRQVSVDFCYTSSVCNDATDTDVLHPLLIFVDPLAEGPVAGAVVAQPGQPVPPLGVGREIYFGPGVYDLGQSAYLLGSNQIARLAGGAYVKGNFAIADGATNVTITGRGILDGAEIPHSLMQPMINGPKMAGHSFVQGITLINANFYNIQLGGVNNQVTSVKAIAWIGNSDGVRAAGASKLPGNVSSLIENCFFKVGDDAIKLFSSNLLVSGCTIWQLDNAAPFEFGVNQFSDQGNITVRDCHVIRTENAFPTLSNAVFSAALGGNANLYDYTFENIDIENSAFRLFKLQMIPNRYTTPNNDNIGSFNGIRFSHITVADTQSLPNLFQSFDRLHRISNVTFDEVTVAGQSLPNPTIPYNVNRRHLALAGTAFSGLLSRSLSDAENFQISLFDGGPSNPSSSITFNQPNLPSTMQVRTMGEFYGDGLASVVLYNSINGAYGLWKEPVLTFSQPWTSQYFPITVAGTGGTLHLPSPAQVVGAGDFNGDGYSDLVTWNGATQSGKILLMKGAQVTSTLEFQPSTTSTWTVAGIGDFQQSGYSDILLRDTSGNLEILYFDATGFTGSADFTPQDLFYSSTAYSNTQFPAVKGHFDSTWNIEGVRDFTGTGYAEILWSNPATGEVGLTTFRPNDTEVMSGQVFAQIPAGNQIQALGDFNGDGAADLLLRDLTTGQSTIGYGGFFGNDLYAPGPTLNPALSPDWAIQVK